MFHSYQEQREVREYCLWGLPLQCQVPSLWNRKPGNGIEGQILQSSLPLSKILSFYYLNEQKQSLNATQVYCSFISSQVVMVIIASSLEVLGAVIWQDTWYKSSFIPGLSNGGKRDPHCIVGGLFNIQRHCSLGHKNESIHSRQHMNLICIESVVGSCKLTLISILGLRTLIIALFYILR